MITEEKFVQYINYIKFLLTLVDIDKEQKHIKSIIKHIQKSFPKDKKNHCEVEHYIFDLNFGKPSLDSEYENPNQLYKRLINDK